MKRVVTLTNEVSVSQEQVKIVELLSNGHQTASVAQELNISKRTLEGKIDRLKAKIGAKTLPHLVATFFRDGVIK